MTLHSQRGFANHPVATVAESGLCSVPLRPLFWVLINSSVSSVGIFVHEDRKGRWICINLLQYIQCLIYYEGFAVLPAYPYTLSFSAALCSANFCLRSLTPSVIPASLSLSSRDRGCLSFPRNFMV